MKRLLSIILSVCMVFSLAPLAFAEPIYGDADIDVKDILEAGSEDDTPDEPGIKPGLNMLTGKTGAKTFENDTEVPEYLAVGGTTSIADNPASDGVNDSSKVLMSKVKATGESYPSVNFYMTDTYKADRPVYVTFKYKKTYEAVADETYKNGSCLWVMRDGGTYIAESPGGFAVDVDWKKFSKIVTFSNALHVTNKTPSSEANLTYIKIQAQAYKNDGYTVFYYDDIAFIPSYKATYMLNDGTDTEVASKYFLFPDNDVTKEVLTEYTFDASIKPTRTDYVFVGWSTDKNAVEPDADGKVELANEDVVLYAVWEKDTSLRKTIKPGLNMVGGQLTPWTSEESDGMANSLEFFEGHDGTFTVSENPLKDDVNSSDTVMKLAVTNSKETYPDVDFTIPGSIETGRPVHVSLKVFKDYVAVDGESIITEKIIWFMNDGKVLWQPTDMPVSDKWMSASKLVTFTSSSSMIYFQVKHSSGNPGTVNYYFDDVSFIPSYKISYMKNDGSDDVSFVDYALYEDDDITKPMLTKYTVDTNVKPTGRFKYKFIGWSTDKNATSAEDITTEVPLDNEDILLYAIWEEITGLPDEVTLKWDFETAESRTWGIANGGYTAKYENGMYVVDTTNRINTSHIKHPDFTSEYDGILQTAGLRYLVIKAKNNGTDNSIKFYFTTTDNPNPSENATVVVPIESNSTVFKEYFVDMSTNALWTGDYKGCMLQINGGKGVVEIEEIYFTTFFGDGDEDVKPVEYHYNLMDTTAFKDYNWGQTWRANNGDGTLYIGKHPQGYAVNGKGMVILYADSSSTTIVGYQDTNADGSVVYYNTANEVVTEAPGVPKKGDGGGFYLPGITSAGLNAEEYKYLVFETTEDSTLTGIRSYFRTSTSGGFNEARALNGKFELYENGKKYCVIDSSSISGYSGIIDAFMIVLSAGSGTVTDIYLTNTPPKNEVIEVTIEKVYLNASSETITEDHGTVTVSPYMRYSDGTVATDFEGTYYITDSVAAQVKTNDDGTATVTAQMNGEVNITAVFPDGLTTLSKKIIISGQAERLAANSFKVMMFGNSIRSHGPSPSIGWPADFHWGMAASSEDKDYAHRFIYYMNKKYGDGVATLVPGGTPAGFEAAAAACTEYNENDFKGYVDGFLSYVKTHNPDIVTIQLGENGGGAKSAEAYGKIMAQVVKGIQNYNPDIIVVLSTPFWSDDTAAKVIGTYWVGKECGIQIAPVNTLGKGAWSADNKNMAFDAPWITEATTSGVKAHPGDEGMDNIAKMFFEKVNITLSANERTEYTTIPSAVEITVDGEAAITEEYGTLNLSASVIPSDAAQGVIWSVDNKDIGSVDENGVVTALNNGKLTVIAKSKYMDTVYGTIEIDISGQTIPYTVTYDKNTTDNVTNMPESNNLAKEGFVFDEVYPVRSTYKFLGWSLKADGTADDVITGCDVTEDTTVYAVWEKAHRWSFERKDYKEEFTVENGFNEYVINDYFTTIATGTDIEAGVILKIKSPVLDLNASAYKDLVLRMRSSEAASDSVVDMVIKTTNGDVSFTKPIPNGEYNEYVFNLKDVTGTITGFEFKPTNVDTTIYIDEIAFVDSYLVEYNANTDDVTVTSMPAGIYKVENGFATLSDIVPVRPGYTFLGWAYTTDSKLLIEEPIAINDGETVTVYAVWDRKDHWEFDDRADYSVGNADSYDVENGYLTITETGIGSNDITVGFKKGFGFEIGNSTKIVYKAKHDLGYSQTGQLFYWTSETKEYSNVTAANGNYSKITSSKYIDTDGDFKSETFHEYTFDLTESKHFGGIINGFRFDPFTGNGTVVVDWVRFADSEANIVTENESTRSISESDWATHIVKKGGTLQVVGGVEIANLALSGDVDMSKGYLAVTDSVEIADGAQYAVFTLDFATTGITADDVMYISGCDVPVKPVDGAKYVVKLSSGKGYVALKKNSSSEVIINLCGEYAENDETTFIAAQFNSFRVVYTDIISACDFVDGKASFVIDEDNSAKLITVASKTNLAPLFDAPVIE